MKTFWHGSCFVHCWCYVWGKNRSPIVSSTMGQYCGELFFPMSAWACCWINSRIAGGLRPYYSPLTVIEMLYCSDILLDTMLNLSPPSAAYMHQWIGSALVQIMACRLFGAKPLPEPILAYCQLDYWEYISVKFESKLYNFHSRKCNSKCRLPKWPFCPGEMC